MTSKKSADLPEQRILELIRVDADFASLEKEHGVKKLHLTRIGEGQGYFALIHLVEVEFAAESVERFKFVLKVPSFARMSDALQGFDQKPADVGHGHAEPGAMSPAQALKASHNRECEMYALFRGLDLPVPRLFHQRPVGEQVDVPEPGVLLIESFVGRAVCPGLYAVSNEAQCLSVARGLARVRAAAARLGPERVRTLREEFRDVSMDSKQVYDTFVPKLLEYDAATFKPLVDRLRPYYRPDFFRYLFAGFARSLNLDSIMHADLTANNVLFAQHADGTLAARVEAFIDWQLSSCGNALTDLARFLLFSTDADLRRAVEGKAVQEYLDEYRRLVGDQVEPHLTPDRCQQLYDLGLVGQALDFQFLWAVFTSGLAERPEAEADALRARLALRLRLGLADCLRLLDKHNLAQVLQRLDAH